VVLTIAVIRQLDVVFAQCGRQKISVEQQPRVIAQLRRDVVEFPLVGLAVENGEKVFADGTMPLVVTASSNQ